MWYNSYIPNGTCSKLDADKMWEGKNSLEFLTVFQMLLRIVMTLFTIEELPLTADERIIKRALIWDGQCPYFDAGKADITGVGAGTFPEGSIMGLFGGGTAGFDVFGYERQAVAVGYNGLHANVNLYRPQYAEIPALQTETAAGALTFGEPNGVMIFDNEERFPPVLYIVQAARRIANMMGACDVAVENLKSPLIIGCEESQLKTVKEAVDAVKNNRYAILTTKNLSLENIQVWQTHMSSDIPKAIWDQILSVFSWFLTIFGVDNNPNPEKKERQTVGEVESNSMLIGINTTSRLASWNRGFEIANELFGTNTRVVLNPEVVKLVEQISNVGGSDEDNSDGGSVRDDDVSAGDSGEDI